MHGKGENANVHAINHVDCDPIQKFPKFLLKAMFHVYKCSFIYKLDRNIRRLFKDFLREIVQEIHCWVGLCQL